jgi:hypothetical protein
MRTAVAWRRYRSDRDPEAGAALARRYSRLADVPEALAAFAGRPGSFADFTRRRALGPPAEPGPVLASAVLSPELAPCYSAMPRRYTPPAPQPDRPAVQLVADVDADVGGAGGEVGDDGEVCGDVQPSPEGVEARAEPAAVPAIPAIAPARGPTPTPTPRSQAVRALVPPAAPPPPRRQVAPRQVAEVRLLPHWHAALSAVHRIARPDSDREVGTIRLEVGAGSVTLFGRDASRAHWAVVPAKTDGAAAVAMDRADVLMRHWGQPGRLSIFEDWLLIEPASGGAYWAPVIPAAVPVIPETTSIAGAVLHRDDLAAAIREAVGGGHLAGLPPEMRIHRADGGLALDAGRGTVTLPAAYVHGRPDIRVAPRWLVEAVSACPSHEVVLETGGPFAPLKVESGWFTCLAATRTAESLL